MFRTKFKNRRRRLLLLLLLLLRSVAQTYLRPNLGRSIALALVKSGTKKKGAKLVVPTVNKSIEVEIASPVFIDPENERLLA